MIRQILAVAALTSTLSGCWKKDEILDMQLCENSATYVLDAEGNCIQASGPIHVNFSMTRDEKLTALSERYELEKAMLESRMLMEYVTIIATYPMADPGNAQ